MARRITDELAALQAEQIVLLDIRPISSFADYFVIATATSPRQLNAIADVLHRRLPDTPRPRREGSNDSGWLLFDFGDVIVHLFSPEERDYYALETLWERAKPLLRIE